MMMDFDFEAEINFDNYLRIDNSDKEPDEVAMLIKPIEVCGGAL